MSNLWQGKWWGVERWERKHLVSLPDADLLAWSDEEAWERYPDLRWIYDKQQLYQKAGEPFRTVNNWPDEGIWIWKPAVNLEGMGSGARVLDAKLSPPLGEEGVLQPYYGEPHLSSDVLLDGGQVIDCWTMQAGTTDNPGEFTLWKSVNLDWGRHPGIQWATQLLPADFRGVVNVETRGPAGHLLELHLRPSLQFFTICQGLLERLPEWYAGGKWERAPWKQTYSVPVFVPKGSVVRRQTVAFLPAGVTEVAVDTSLAQPLNCTRLGYVNGTNLSQCLQIAAQLARGA